MQLYSEDAICTFATPVKRLTAFRRVHLEPGKTQTVTFQLAPSQLAILDANMNPRVEPGEFKVQLGGSSSQGLLASLWIE